MDENNNLITYYSKNQSVIVPLLNNSVPIGATLCGNDLIELAAIYIEGISILFIYLNFS
jgi:hypothetical protein